MSARHLAALFCVTLAVVASVTTWAGAGGAAATVVDRSETAVAFASESEDQPASAAESVADERSGPSAAGTAVFGLAALFALAAATGPLLVPHWRRRQAARANANN